MKHVAGVEVIGERPPDAYAFTLRANANGRTYRVAPERDPDQPRFWCVVVYRCSPGGLPDGSERPWVGPCGLRREDLKETLGAIRSDPGSWLAEDSHGALRAWMLAPAATER